MKLIAIKHISSQRPVGAVFELEGKQARLLIALKAAKEHVEEKPPRQSRSAEKPPVVEKASSAKPSQGGSRGGHNRRDFPAPENRADMPAATPPSAPPAAPAEAPADGAGAEGGAEASGSSVSTEPQQ